MGKLNMLGGLGEWREGDRNRQIRPRRELEVTAITSLWGAVETQMPHKDLDGIEPFVV